MSTQKIATFALLLAAAGISRVQAQDGVYICDALEYPNYDSCDIVNSEIPWNEGDSDKNIKDGDCRGFFETGNIGNCIIFACNFRGDGQTQPLNVFSGDTRYQMVKQWCEPDDSGGQAPASGSWIVRAVNNPDYKPSAAKRAAVGKLSSVTMSKKEVEALTARARQVNLEKLVSRDGKFNKRAESWQNLGLSRKVTHGQIRDRLSAIGGSGSSQQWATSEGFSTAVTTSASMTAGLFDIFSASVEISTTQEETFTYTETMIFDPSSKCEADQSAVLYMYPLFDRYVGMFDDDDTEWTVWVPVDEPNNYSLEVECLG